MKNFKWIALFVYASMLAPAANAATANWTGTIAVSPFDIQKIKFESGTNSKCKNVAVSRVERRDCEVADAYVMGAAGNRIATFNRVTIFLKVLSSQVIREYHYYGVVTTSTESASLPLQVELAFWHDTDQTKIVGSYTIGDPSSSWGIQGQLD